MHFIEGGKAQQMMDKSVGVGVLNFTLGTSALRQGKPVYCVGTSIYAMPGLAVNSAEMALDAFWNAPRRPEDTALVGFEQVLKARALVNGKFYIHEGIRTAIIGVLQRLDGASEGSLPSLTGLPREPLATCVTNFRFSQKKAKSI